MSHLSCLPENVMQFAQLSIFGGEFRKNPLNLYKNPKFDFLYKIGTPNLTYCNNNDITYIKDAVRIDWGFRFLYKWSGLLFCQEFSYFAPA